MTPRLPIWQIAAGVALVVVLAVLAWNFDPFGRRKNAEQKAANATAQAQADQATTKALDTFVTRTVVIREKTDAAVSSVQSAPGADQPLDPVRRDRLCAALASVRGSPVCSDPDGAGEPSEAVSGADKPDAD